MTKTVSVGALVSAVLAVSMGSAVAMEVAKDGENTMNVNGRLQVLGAVEDMDNHGWKDDTRLLLFLKQARLNINGQYKGCDYKLQTMFGGEEVPKSRSGSVMNSVVSLLDAYVNVPFVEDSFEFKMGQFKVPYGRERLADSGTMINADRSIQNNFFNIGYDVGAAAHTKSGAFTAALGVFTGGGPDIPQRYIPEDLGLPMLVTRIGVNNGLDKDLFTPYETGVSKEGTKYAAYINGAYTEDSRVGHSTPLNVKVYDSSIMINPNWNPYIGAANQKAEFYQVGGDAAVQIPLSEGKAVQLSAEYNFASFDNDKGSLEANGGVVSIAMINNDLTYGIRYSMVEPDENMAYTKKTEATETTPASTKLFPITDKTISEITPFIAYNMSEYGIVVKADVSLMMDTPLSIEKDHGLYNLMLQPDQTSYSATGGIDLQDVYVAKVVVQYDF